MSPATRVRVISAGIALCAFLLVIKFSGYVGISVMSFFICFAALYEYSKMALSEERYKLAKKSFVILGLIAYTISIYKNDLLLHIFVLSTLAIFIFYLFLARDENIPLEELTNKAGHSLFGILYAGLCPVYISLLARLPGGLQWFFYTMIVVFSGDTAAYFVGHRFGRTRLFTRISPKKTVEGAIGSLFASVFAGLLLHFLILRNTDLFLMLFLSILTSVVAQLGDLCESMIKRSFHTKDSGRIMPGHGGLLDRIDGILFAAPVVYIYAKYLVLP